MNRGPIGLPWYGPTLGGAFVTFAANSGHVSCSIARSDGTRAVVVEELFDTRVTGGILGSFSFDRYGDITPAAIGLYSIRDGALVVDGVVRVPSRPDR
ncbi:MAG TPA: hypothetical protein VM925_11280 [Labilithrix sp.]|nr:hypothetical protein [Labilithrix sp.]